MHENSIELYREMDDRWGIILSTTVRPFYEQTVQAAREALGEEAFQAARNEGSRMTVEEAIDLAQRQG